MPSKLVVQILAPVGRDAELLSRFLEEEGIPVRVWTGSIFKLTDQDRDQAGALLIAEEALTPAFIITLGELLSRQPAWSDLPFLLLTTSGRETADDLRKQSARLPLGHVTILERPLRPTSLLSAVQSALRAREKQYEVREASEDLAKAYAELRMSEQQNRLILESTHDCIKLLDLEGNLLSINEEGQRRFGIDDIGSVCGSSWLIFWKGLDLEAARFALHSARSGNAGRFEAFFETPAGEATWWDISITPVRNDEGSIINLLAVSREISDRKRTEQALIQNEKLAAVGRLASTISHEINNPLEAVMNLIYIAMNDERIPADILRTLAAADDELKRAAQIVGQTLRFHRQSTRPKLTTPEELISTVIALYQGRLANSHIETDVHYGTGKAFYCYDGEIRQVISNLVGNAIDAMRAGGKLLIRTRSATDRVRQQDGVMITVADTGHGMPPEVTEKIFDAFYSTKGDNGTGLGLWITKGIVEKHHGRLSVRSTMGSPSGTVFRLFLPLQGPPVVQEEPLAPAV